jgi:hypothetical protein
MLSFIVSPRIAGLGFSSHSGEEIRMGVVKDGFGENGGRYQGVKVKRYIMVYGVNPRKKPTPSQAGLGFEPPTPRIESELATSLATVPSLQMMLNFYKMV